MNSAQFVIGIIDDNDVLRTAIGSLLRSDGYAVACFASAEDFLRCPSQAAFHCLVVDVRLAGMSGLELLQRLGASGRGIPAICITAQKDTDGRIREHALRMGAQELLYKPFEAEDLLRAVRSIRDRGRHQP
jgi:FixJ family two-component response regulator